MSADNVRRGATSASSAQADLLCAGRHQAQKGIADTPSADAEFGVQIHDALKSGRDDTLTPEQQSIFEGCQQIERSLVDQYFGIDAASVKVFREQRFWCNVVWMAEDGTQCDVEHSGQPDVVYRHGVRVLILEYKTLPGDVPESNRNLQLRDQAVLVKGSLAGVTEIGVAVIQPLVTYESPICQYDATALKQAETEMFARVAASNAPDAKRVPGAEQCKYCKAKLECPEYNKWSAVTVPGTTSLVDLPIKEWTPQQRATFCEQLPAATKWLEECKAEMKRLLRDDPEAVPGWTLGTGKNLSTITNPNELHQRFIAIGGNTEAFMGCVEIGKGKLQLALREVTKLKGKALDKKLDELLEGLTVGRQSEASLTKK